MPEEAGGAPVEGGTATEATQTSAPDFSPVLDRVAELASTIDGRFAAFEERLPALEAPVEQDPWAGILSAAEEDQPQYFDAFGNQVEIGQQQQVPALDPNALQSAVQQAIQQATQPLNQQITQMQQETALKGLYQRIPQLEDVPKGHEHYERNQAARQQTAQLVEQRLQAYPPQVAQILANDAGFIETVFKAAEAERLAAGQVPAGEGVPAVEAAGGAAPSGAGGKPDYVNSAFSGGWQGLPKGFR